MAQNQDKNSSVARDERLKAALKANLARRKAQSRARASQDRRDNQHKAEAQKD